MPPRRTPPRDSRPVAVRAKDALAALERRGSRRNVQGMARYGIVAAKAFGVSVADIRALGKRLGRDHALALALWDSGWYEARLLAAFVDDPAAVTPAQMDRWARSFENWADCDTVCFHLFDKTPHAWGRVRAWAPRKEEFVRRAAFALLASMSLHLKQAPDPPFAAALRLVDAVRHDDRNFVKKGVVWALRGIAGRSAPLRAKVIARARKLAASDEPNPRWIGKSVLRELKAGS